MTVNESKANEAVALLRRLLEAGCEAEDGTCYYCPSTTTDHAPDCPYAEAVKLFGEQKTG